MNDDNRPNLLCGDGRGLANLLVGLQPRKYIDAKAITDFDERLKRLEAAGLESVPSLLAGNDGINGNF